nr:MAG TPA: hypothetical protein [Caudoviricetes sp.]
METPFQGAPHVGRRVVSVNKLGQTVAAAQRTAAFCFRRLIDTHARQ